MIKIGVLKAKIAGTWVPIQYGVAYATDAETITGTETAKAVTPASLKYERPYIDARTYGVGPSAIAATNRAGINNALIAASAISGVVLLPPGTLDLDAAIVATTNATLQGSRRGTTLRMTGAGRVINITNVPNFTLRDLTIDCNKASVADDGTTAQHGIFVSASNATGCPGTVIERVKVINAWDRGICAQAVTLDTNPLDLRIVDCEVSGSTGAGMFLQNSQRTLVQGCDVYANSLWGIHVVGGRNATIRNNRVHDQIEVATNRAHGIVVNTGNVGALIEGNTCYNNVGSNAWGIVVGINTKQFRVIGNHCYDNWGGITCDVADTVTNPIDTRGVVADNIVTGSTASNGLHVNQADGLTIIGNQCAYNAQTGIEIYGRNCVVDGNESHHNGRHGISFRESLTPPLASAGPHTYGVNRTYSNNTSAGGYLDFYTDTLTNGPARPTNVTARAVLETLGLGASLVAESTASLAGAAPSLIGKAGEYWSSPVTRNVLSLVAGTLYTHMIYVPFTKTIDRIGVEVTTLAAGSTISLGIYNDDGTGLPGTLLADFGTVSGAALAAVEATISQLLTGGNTYHLAAMAQGGTPAVRTLTGAWQGTNTSLANATTSGAGLRSGRSRASASGTVALPTPAGTLTLVSAVPVIAVRLA